MKFILFLASILILFVQINSIFLINNGKKAERKLAKLGQAPYMVGIYYAKEFMCGGSIISKKTVLTAAHCIPKRQKKMNVIVGTTYSNYTGTTGTIYEVKRTKIHPKYDDFDEDVALIFIKGTFEWSDTVQPISLNSRNVYDYDRAVLTGWGAKHRYGDESERLKYLTGNIVDHFLCSVFHYEDPIRNNVCFNSGLLDGVCSGDSGGPLVANGTQIGIAYATSYICGLAPGLYMRVDKYVDWINKYKI